MSDRDTIVTELKLDSGELITTMYATPREFKTGSRGYSAHKKVEIGGKRYQVQIQIVEIGSKKPVVGSDG